MKKLITLFILLTISLQGNSQVASRLLSGQAIPYRPVSAPNYLYVDTGSVGMYRILAAHMDSLRLKPINITWLNDSVISIGNTHYAQLLGAYNDPAFVNNLNANKVFGLSSVALTGDYNDLTNKPNTSIFYLASNPSGYISNISGGMISAALGYQPYNGTSNPLGFITSAPTYTAGSNLGLMGNQFYVDTTSIMTKAKAERAIDSMMVSKADTSTTITINGNSRSLRTGGTWNVGTLVGLDTLSLNNRINTKQDNLGYIPLKPSDTLNKWKPISYTPTNAEVTSALGYTPIQSEVDPTVASHIKSITTTNISNWNTTFGWGNPSLTYLKITDTANKWLPKSTTIPSNTNQLTNGAGFITGISQANVTSALGYTPLRPSDTTNKWIPIGTNIPSQVNIIGGVNTKVSGNYPNITVSDSFTNKVYNSSGIINQNIKTWVGTVSPSTSNGYSIDISSAGFTQVLSVSVIAIRNTNVAATSPNVSIKSKTNSAITVNVTEDNLATITILGINVLSGAPSVFANITGLTLDVTVIGY